MEAKQREEEEMWSQMGKSERKHTRGQDVAPSEVLGWF